MKNGVRSCWPPRRGQAAVEYALLLVMVFALGAVGLTAVGTGARAGLSGSFAGALASAGEPAAPTSQPAAPFTMAAAGAVQAQATGRVFYVDGQAGGDSRSGLSPETAWRTIAKVNQTALAPGDTVLLKRGCQWREQLTVPSSGAAGAAIKFGAYGSGPKPRINGAAAVTGWSRYSGSVWAASLATQPSQVFFEGARGVKEAGMAALDAPGEWCWASGKLYVFSASDPTTAFPTQGVEASVRYGIFAWQKNYLAIEEIECTRGIYGVCLVNSSNATCTSVEGSWNYYDGLMADGAASSAVTFENCSGHDNARHGVVANSAVNVTVRGGRYHGNAEQYGAGVSLNGGRGSLVSGVEATGNFYGIKTSNGAADMVICDNVVYDNLDFGIDLDSGTLATTVERNQVYGNGSHGIVVEYESSGCTVARNLCHDNGPQQAGIFVEMASGVLVHYNVVRNEYIGIRFNYNATDCAAYNNVVYDIGGVAFSAFNNCSGITWENNIAGACAYLMVHVRPDSQTGFRSDYNDWQVNGFQLEWGWDRLSFAQWQGATGQDTHSLAADPLFASAEGGDFRLQAQSPCVDAGANVGLTADYAGAQVPQGTAPDIGAFEGAGTPSAPRHDIAVISVTAPADVAQGDLVAVSVLVANAGDSPETFSVTLADGTDGGVIAVRTLAGLAPGGSASVTFDWDTSAASPGGHALRATADAVAGETNTADNSAEASVTVLAPLSVLHVAGISVTARRKPSPARATAVVTIVDEDGAAVPGATVWGAWTGAAAGDQSAVTDGAGRATFSATKSRSGNTFTFTVTNVVKAGCRYDPSLNAETSDSATAR